MRINVQDAMHQHQSHEQLHHVGNGQADCTGKLGIHLIL